MFHESPGYIEGQNLKQSFMGFCAGKSDSASDSGDLIAQLYYRKAAMTALKRQFEATRATSQEKVQDLRIANSRLEDAKTQLAKVDSL